MKIIILSVGKAKDPRVALMADRYLKRLRTFVPATLESVPEAKDPSPSRKVEKEGRGILKAVRERDYLVTLEERGEAFDSPGFSEWISSRIESAPGRVLLVLGGAFGLSEEVRQRSDFALSLSPMTMPHELCLVLLLEQLYRAFTILRGVEYHH
jgi:23S rRNA (pseudouridine1915-N3)-methyltransferase